MKATEAKLLDFLKKSPQFVIPIYQRTYSWTEKECRQLWDDVIRCGNCDNIAVHFVGSIVYVESGLSQVTHQSPLLVIDGQQRLTTVTLLLAALAEAVGEGEPLDGFSKRKIRNYFLVNPEETDDRHFKLLLSQTDKDTLTAIVGRKQQPDQYSLRVDEAYRLFRELIEREVEDLSALCKGLAKLVVVDIALNRDEDNPQLIFESMNSTGKELSQADLIRNYILMGLEPKLQTRLYEEFWRPMELDFGQEAYSSHFDRFMRHYLTVMTGELPNIGAVYEAFKDFARARKGGEVDENTYITQIVSNIREYARYFCAIALSAETDPELQRAFHDLRELKVDVSYPFLLELYDDYTKGQLLREDFLRVVRLVESYVFRRAISAIPTNSLNKTFANLTKGINKERYLESVEAQFLLLPSYRRFPRDDEFFRNIQTRDLYNFRSRSYWLRRFENYGRKEFVPVDEYTIEHILPQNEQLSEQWQAVLGDRWQEIRNQWLHTLGNLTLTGYNSEYSDRPFAEKRDMNGGFKQSPLRLNEGLGQVEEWNEQAIKARAAKLAAVAIQVWRAPQLDDEELAEYHPKNVQGSSYSVADHRHLESGAIRPLFEAFRKAVLALDPCIVEEFKKKYIAYKAETNCVDVVPQAKRLKLFLKIQYHEISDPRGLCREVTGKGHRRNGHVKLGLSSLEELPYAISLVSQALEKQLGDAAEE